MSATHILPMRFRIKLDAPVDQVKVKVFNYPYHAIKSVQDAVQHEAKITRFYNKQYPPLRQLGTVFNLLIPGLIHPFYFDTHSWRTQPLLALGDNTTKYQNDQIQPLLTLSSLHQSQLLSRRRIHEVITNWVHLWLQRKDLNLTDYQINKLLTDFKKQLSEGDQDWIEQDISSYMIYRAIPSLIASLMVQNSSDPSNSLQLEGQPIRWYLVQSNDHLHLISDIKKGARDSSFAYKVDFSLQDHAGSSEKWLHIYLHVQRYSDAKQDYPVRLNNRRGARVMMRRATPYVDWSNTEFLPQTFIPLWVDYKNEGWQYRYGPQILMDKLKIVNSVIDANLLRQNPAQYRDVSAAQDQYRVVYSEGMKPNHGMETGASMEARRQIMAMFADTLSDWLEPAEPLPKDEKSKMNRLDALREHSYIAKRKLTETDKDLDEVKQKFDKTHPRLIEGFRRAVALESENKAVVLLCWHRPQTVGKVQEKIRRLFNTDIIGVDPTIIEFIPTEIDRNRLISRLELTEENAKQREKQRLSELRKRKQEWEKWIANLLVENNIDRAITPVFSLIELPDTTGESNIKSAIRGAFSSQGIPSQMFAPVPIENDYTTQDDMRLIAAVSDLLLRQAGVTFTDARTFHGRIHGKETDFSNRLIVTSLFRLRQRGVNPIDYAIAVRWLPEGTVQARTPNHDWEDYWKLVPKIGAIFYDSKQRSGKKDYKLDKEPLIQFFKEVILSQPNNRPHIVTLSADDWRSIIPAFKNTDMKKDILNIGDDEITTKEFENLRIVRLRFHQPLGETPQYVALKGLSWRFDDVDTEEETVEDQIETDTVEVNQVRGTYTSGFVDDTIAGQFFHYASIGRVPITASPDQYKFNSIDEQHGKGGTIPFKHQTIVEIVPFFSSDHSDDHITALTVSAMRSIPSWQQGHILLPYLMHLGKQALIDQSDVLDVGSIEIQDEDD